MDTRKLRERFEIVKSLRTNSIHPTIDKVRKKRPRGNEHPKYDSLWYMKREPKCDNPVKEVIGQEFFRLFLPSQPKTRLMLKNDVYGGRNQFYILSKEIPGYLPFLKIMPMELLTNILNGSYTGLGQVLVASLFLRENDLHQGNIGIDENGRVVKIDGGFIFNSGKKTTAADIAALPKLARSYPTNWLGINSWKKELDKSVFYADALLANKQIRELPAFRHEVNQMLLKICLLPNELIRKMIISYGAEERYAEELFEFLIESKYEIQEAASANSDFICYVASKEADEDLQEFFTHLAQFKTTGKHYILQDENKDLGFIDAMTARFAEMRMAAEKQRGESSLMYYGRLFGLVSPAETAESIAVRLRRCP